MKLGYIIALLAVLYLLAYCLWRVQNKNREVKEAIKRYLRASILTVVSCLLTICVVEEHVSVVTHTIYQVALVWSCYYFLDLSAMVTEIPIPRLFKRDWLKLLVIADNISLFINMWKGYYFQIGTHTLLDESIYCYPITTNYFYIHLGFLYALVALAIVCMFYRAKNASEYIKRKYKVVITLITVVIFGNAIVNQFHIVIDISVVVLVLCGVSVYYGSIVYIPQQLSTKALNYISKYLKDALVFMDSEGNCIHVNESAKEILEQDYNHELLEWCKNIQSTNEKDVEVDKILCDDERTRFLKISYHRLEDFNGNLQGGVFVFHDYSDEIANLKRERFLASLDKLTGLYTKDYFYEQAEEMLHTHSDVKYLMLCFDIREFKVVNELYGMNAGDEVLVKLADLLKRLSIPNKVYGRLDNDRFALLMPKEYFYEEMFLDYTKARNLMRADINYPLICHIGVYEVKNHQMEASRMCDRAQMAIATIKTSYQKRIAYYDDKIRNAVLEEKELTSLLSEAITEGQLAIHLQPQVDGDGKLLGAEALVRWYHPEKGIIMPSQFVPIFEKNGMISRVDLYVWERACKLLSKWKDMGREDLYISVNISPRDFFLLDIYEVLMGLVKKYEINPANLKLEITETAIMKNVARNMELIEKLRSEGFVVEMDDFGSGYSSLNTLKDITVDVLKIDMAFLEKSDNEERSKNILQMIISLSKQLGMPVITEGVETEEQVKYLSEMGCDVFQGYFFAKPMEIEKFHEVFMSSLDK